MDKVLCPSLHPCPGKPGDSSLIWIWCIAGCCFPADKNPWLSETHLQLCLLTPSTLVLIQPQSLVKETIEMC